MRARTDRPDPTGPRRRRAEPLGHLTVHHRLHPVVHQDDRARHEQGVHRAVHRVEGEVGHQPHTAGGDHRAAVGRGDPHGVSGPGGSGDTGGDREHLGRSGDVQQLHAGEGGDDDAVGCRGHAPIMLLGQRWPQ